MQPLRAHIDHGSRGANLPRRVSTVDAIRETLANPALRRLTVAAFVLMTVHTCFQTFTVAFLVEHVGLGLTRPAVCSRRSRSPERSLEWHWDGCRTGWAGPVEGSISIGPLVFTATVSIAGSYPVAFWLGAAVSLVATVNLLRIPGTAGR